VGVISNLCFFCKLLQDINKKVAGAGKSDGVRHLLKIA
jgi:hypothetical protein